MANCWYNLPTIPGINPTGTNTAARIRAIATTGPEMSFIARSVASRGRKLFMINIMLHGFHDHDGIIYHDSNGQNKSKKRQCVNSKPERNKKYKCCR